MRHAANPTPRRRGGTHVVAGVDVGEEVGGFVGVRGRLFRLFGGAAGEVDVALEEEGPEVGLAHNLGQNVVVVQQVGAHVGLGKERELVVVLEPELVLHGDAGQAHLRRGRVVHGVRASVQQVH